MLQQREVEKYDSVSAQRYGIGEVGFLKKDWLITLSKLDDRGAWSAEYSPAHDFYVVGKTFYPNGSLHSKGRSFGRVPIGIYEEYDEVGNLIKVVDEDKKFGKIKPKDIVELLEKEGWFNRETGENKITEKEVLPTTGEFYREIIKYTRITYIPQERSQTGRAHWRIRINPCFWGHTTIYVVDGDTGEFTKEEKFVMKYE
ncbi:hypothetical protein [Porphyromonas endodontalis]|uniref:hypothetical protein n=1 Tax=Porphyromonas endodontalis TaxID=28124 RepID=UPI0028E8572C|nr:hypothetical protein [Porphyromonas endodontalis]